MTDATKKTDYKPPSVYDTHCSGPGLLPETQQWTKGHCTAKRYKDEIFSNLSLPPQMNLHGKNVLISGSNSGIGFEAAFTFALWGAKVIMACRDPPIREIHPIKAMELIVERGQGKIDKSQLEWWQVDYISLKSVQALGNRWVQSGMVLDYLCNNAGLTVLNKIITEDGFELTRSVNYLGHCLLTLIVLPTMKNAESPRIVNTCSAFHYGGRLDFSSLDYEADQDRGRGGVLAYCDTKLQHLMWTMELQQRLSRSEEYRHVIVNGIHPGFVSSGIWQNPELQSLPWPTPQIFNFIVKWVSINPSQGSLAILYAALHPKFGFKSDELQEKHHLPSIGESARIGGQYLNRNQSVEALPECYDVLVRSRLWQRSLEDIKAEQLDLLQGLPGPLPSLK